MGDKNIKKEKKTDFIIKLIKCRFFKTLLTKYNLS